MFKKSSKDDAPLLWSSKKSQSDFAYVSNPERPDKSKLSNFMDVHTHSTEFQSGLPAVAVFYSLQFEQNFKWLILYKE